MARDFGRYSVVANLLASAAMIVASVCLVWVSFRQPGRPSRVKVPASPVSIDAAASKGSKTAKVIVIEFTDMQCPFCRRFTQEVFPFLDEHFISTGQVLFVVRHFPLVQIHPFAQRAAEAAECARRQDKFWPFHDALFHSTDPANDRLITAGAQKAGLADQPFTTCLNGEAVQTIQEDQDLGKRLGISSTPTFLLGAAGKDGRVQVRLVLEGLKSIGEFKDALDSMLGAR